MEFSNDIYGAECYPLYLATGSSTTREGTRSTGRILLWINRAHVAGGRLFIAPCDIAAPLEASTVSARIGGYVSDWWFEGTLVDGPDWPRVALNRLVVPGWSSFSNPSFCGRNVAFWQLHNGSQMTAHVVNLFDPRVRSSLAFGRVAVDESDMGWGVPPASWDQECTSATFRSESNQRTVMAPRAR